MLSNTHRPEDGYRLIGSIDSGGINYLLFEDTGVSYSRWADCGDVANESPLCRGSLLLE